MKVIKPTEVLNSTLVSSNVTADANPEWNSSTSYTLGDVVKVSDDGVHKLYTALGSSLNSYPPNNPTDWEEGATTNRWKMFNQVVQDQTVFASSIDVTVAQGAIINGIALINVYCDSIDVTVTDPVDGVVYDETFSMVSTSGISNWYEYFFTNVERKTELAIVDLPPYPNAEINVVLNGTGDVKCGALVFGQAVIIGDSQYGANFGIIDYSTKNVDDEGNITISEGAYADEANIDVVIQTYRFAQVKKILTQLRNIPCVWVVNEATEGTVLYGYYREFDVLYTGPVVAMCTLSIEGLI